MDSPFNILSLCSGVGMLDLGVELGVEFATGKRARTVCYVEREAAAAAILLARMEDSALEPAPIWCGDIERFNAAAWRGTVDCVTAGYPCQPHSVAGKKAGLSDERWIWPAIADVIRVVGPDYVFLENVPGLVTSGGLDATLGDLHALGFDAQWGVLSASAVGASHLRERIFILAYARHRSERSQQSIAFAECGGASDDCISGEAMGDSRCEHGQLQQWGVWSEPAPASGPLANSQSGGCREYRQSSELKRGCAECGDQVVANTESDRGRFRVGLQQPRRDETQGASEVVDDTIGARRDGAWGESIAEQQGGKCVSRERCENMGNAENPDRRSELPSQRAGRGRSGFAGANSDIFAPGPLDPRWPGIIADSPGLAPAIKPGFRLMADGMAYTLDDFRADRLRAIGNGVVPLQAAAAFVELYRRADVD